MIASFQVDVQKIGDLGILSRDFSQKPFWQSSEEIQDHKKYLKTSLKKSLL